MAVIPNNVVRVSLLFSVFPGDWDELSMNTFHLQQQAGPSGPVPDVQYIADQVAAKLTAHWSLINTFYPSGVQITAIKTYLLDATGHSTAEGTHAVPGGTLSGGGTSGSLPPEVAVALSLYSYPPGGFATQKGRKRGRLFLGPVNANWATTTGRVNLSDAGDLVAGWKAIFDDINTIESAAGRTDPMGLVILSRTGGATYQVLHLRCDDHFDAQRRRQHQAPAGTRSSDLVPW